MFVVSARDFCLVGHYSRVSKPAIAINIAFFLGFRRRDKYFGFLRRFGKRRGARWQARQSQMSGKYLYYCIDKRGVGGWMVFAASGGAAQQN